MPEEIGEANAPLARQLLLASRWFDIRSRDLLVQRGWPRLSAAQTLLFAQLVPGNITVAELARRLGHSRQATHEMVRGLVKMGFLELHPDPQRRGGRLVCLSSLGDDLVADAYAVLLDLEASLDTEQIELVRGGLAALNLYSHHTP